jgi:hypothetical protein
MTILKSLTIVAAIFVGGASLAMAQNGLPTGGELPVGGGAAGGPPGPGVIPNDVQAGSMQSAAPRAAPRYRHMYMSAKGSHHKPLKTGQQLPKQPQ